MSSQLDTTVIICAGCLGNNRKGDCMVVSQADLILVVDDYSNDVQLNERCHLARIARENYSSR